MQTQSKALRRVGIFAVFVCLISALGCGAAPENNNNTNNTNTNNNTKQVDQGLTFHKDVRSIIEQKCQNCHQPGHIGSFSLMNFKDVLTYKAAIKDAIVSRRMPPWKPDDGCNEYKHSFGLSEKEIKTVVDWVEQGSKEGDPSAYVKPNLPKLPTMREDIKLKLPLAYKPKKMPDDYRCFIVDWPHKTDKYVTGYKVTADNKKITHHLIAYVIPPNAIETFQKYDDADKDVGYTCYGGPTGKGGGRDVRALTNVRWIGAWAPGRDTNIFPQGTGVKVPGGSKVILQMHYNVLSNDPKPDQSSISFQVEDKVKKEAFIRPFANPSWIIGQTMGIPAGSVGTKHSFSSALSDKRDLLIHGVGLHLHTRGKTGSITIQDKEGKTKSCGLKISKWDFNWQGSYQMLKPIRVNKGEKVNLSCTWDNSAANQPMINGKKSKPVDLNWGDGTHDEMCLGILFITAAD